MNRKYGMFLKYHRQSFQAPGKTLEERNLSFLPSRLGLSHTSEEGNTCVHTYNWKIETPQNDS